MCVYKWWKNSIVRLIEYRIAKGCKNNIILLSNKRDELQTWSKWLKNIKPGSRKTIDRIFEKKSS